MNLAQHRRECQIRDIQSLIDEMRSKEIISVRDSDGSEAEILWPKRLRIQARLEKIKAQPIPKG